MDLMEDVFVAMGWEVAEGPELEAEWLNFDALNFIPDHPARTMQDTLFVEPDDGGLVLRTHTSPVQARTHADPRAADLRGLPRQGLPRRRVRRDPPAGLPPDRGAGRWTRASPSATCAAPSTTSPGRCSARPGPGCGPTTSRSPSRRPRSTCSASSATAPRSATRDNPCRTCKSEGWIEWGGCGVVNPRVLVACGIDPDVYSGFAFGMGVDRTLMFRNNSEDMRDMIEGDVRFSRSLVGLAR